MKLLDFGRASAETKDPTGQFSPDGLGLDKN